MLFSPLFERFARRAPMVVMSRALFEHALAPAELDHVFCREAQTQYQRSLLFSSLVDLMSVVVCKVQPSVNAAYRAVHDTLPVSLAALDEKLARVEPHVVQSLVRHVATRLRAVIEALGSRHAAVVPGYRMKILDGNHQRAGQRRLAALWDSAAAPLPAQSLVVFEPELGLMTDLFPCEDAHAQERSLLSEVLRTVVAGDLWVADRNFCTFGFLTGIAERQGFFAIRQHAGLRVESAGTLRRKGRCDTGDVFEQPVTLVGPKGERLEARRIVVRLATPTREGTSELAIVTNLPAEVPAATVAAAYRKRWQRERAFLHLTQHLNGEIDTLAYPRAALLGFAMAVNAANVLASLGAALRAAHGDAASDEKISGYYLANEVRRYQDGLELATEETDWQPLQTATACEVADWLRVWAGHARLAQYKKSPRGPKKTKPKRTAYAHTPQVSTARILIEKTGKLTP